MACAGRFLTASKLSAPKYCETIADIALLVCPKIQISIDKNVPTIPTAAKDSTGLTLTFPTIAVSVIDKIGSDIPEISAGIANLLMYFKLMVELKALIHSNEMDIHFVWENKYHLVFYNREVRKTFGFFYFVKTYLSEQI